jgi:hypothetical protein
MEHNFGALLAKQERDRAADKDLGQRQEQRQADIQRERNLRDFQTFLTDFANDSVTDIQANIPLRSMEIPKKIADLRYAGGRYVDNTIFPNSPKHALYDAFVDIERGIILRYGLKFKFNEQDDGGGMRSWQVVRMVPATAHDVEIATAHVPGPADEIPEVPAEDYGRMEAAMLSSGIDRRGPSTRVQELFAEAEQLRNRLRNVEKELMNRLSDEHRARTGENGDT